jgi:antigen flippase
VKTFLRPAEVVYIRYIHVPQHRPIPHASICQRDIRTDASRGCSMAEQAHDQLPEIEVASGMATHGQILKSSALIGGASVLSVAVGMVRTKAMAVLLGPSGVGLLGMYGSIAELAQSIAGMGINSSGVRQIAEAAGSGDGQRVARTAAVLRRISIVLGLAGAGLVAAFSAQISVVTFGSAERANAVALLSLAVMFGLVSSGQGALIQGMRRIRDLAAMRVLGSILGTVVSIVLVYLMRADGLVPALVSIAAMSLATSWWYSRRVHMPSPALTSYEVGSEARALLKLGVAFMASGFLIMGAAYAVKTMVLRNLGLDAAGMYQAAWTIGGLYIGFILQAMGADFYPRLVAVADNHSECNRLVNEQAEVSMLLAGPGVIATLIFAPLIIFLFYSSEFGPAVEILRWICLGMALRVLTWPMGFIIVAKGAQVVFFLSELAWTIVCLGLAWFCMKAFGLKGAGIAFFGSYIFHALIIYPIVRKLSGFRWSATNRKTGLLFIGSIAVVFSALYALPSWWAAGVGVVAMVLSGLYSARTILNLMPLGRVPRPLSRLLGRRPRTATR